MLKALSSDKKTMTNYEEKGPFVPFLLKRRGFNRIRTEYCSGCTVAAPRQAVGQI